MTKKTKMLIGSLGAALVVLLLLGLVLVLSQHPDKVAFYGDHQAGILTPAQKFVLVAAFDLRVKTTDEIRTLLQTWTATSHALTQGLPVGPELPGSVSAADTGETLGYKPARLTLTFGVGPSLFDGRFGLAAQRPAALEPLPAFNGDQLNPDWSDGDLVVQVCADDFQTAYHALHTLTRQAKGLAVMRWVQSGFQAGLETNPKGPGRNLEGFIDGTVNPDRSQAQEMDQVVWADPDQAWIRGGSYLVMRRIRMFVEVWDRSSLGDQERTIGRERAKGNELPAKDENSHVSLAHGDGSQKILRRPFHYLNGLDGQTGQFDAGLLFLAYMKDPRTQFVPIQTRLSNSDLLNEYIRPVGSAVFAILPGVQAGEYLGSSLFPQKPLTARIETLQSAVGALYPALSRADWLTVREGAAKWQALWQKEHDQAGKLSEQIDALAATWNQTLASDSPDTAAVRLAQGHLLTALEGWASAVTPKAKLEATDLSGLKQSLSGIQSALTDNDSLLARQVFNAFQQEWVKREALVRGLDTTAYGAIESQIGTVRRSLEAASNSRETEAAVKVLVSQIASLKSPGAFGPWDAAFLLFREGLEALLVLAALLAFLGKTNQKQQTPWVWTGALTGLLASAGIALLVSSLMTGWLAATTPELVEGITGIVALIMMLSIGGWLHSKAAIKNWNVWLKEQMGRHAQGPWALALLAFLAVLREGAETVIFFWGLAGSIAPLDLVIGIFSALIVLTVLGILLIGFSKRLPLQWFFPLATGLIYFLAIKILGQSLAAFQSIGIVPSTPLGFASAFSPIGFVPSWETALPQLILAVILFTLLIRSILKGIKPKTPSTT